jgi:GntR family transcriptional repressor for pyruvate dehydrogenase complex
MSGVVRRARTSVTEDAITRNRQMILTGELAPGDRLPPEADLAVALGLSRTSLREAVRALTVLGVIITRQGDASYISSLGPELLLGALGLAVDLQREDTMPDLVAVRRILEAAATAMAARRITDPELQHLRTLMQHDGDTRSDDRLALDREFHRAVARASGNELLVALLDALSEPTMRMRTLRGNSVPGALDRSAAEHQMIFDGLEAHDPDLARAAATLHVAGVESWARSLEPGWSTLAAREP